MANKLIKIRCLLFCAGGRCGPGLHASVFCLGRKSSASVAAHNGLGKSKSVLASSFSELGAAGICALNGAYVSLSGRRRGHK